MIFEGPSTSHLPVMSSSIPLTLGADLLKFVVLGGTSVLFGSDRTTLLSGSVGVSPGTTISGNYLLKDGSTESNTIAAKAAASELATAYNTGSTMSCQHSLSTGELSGLSPMPGVYCSMSGVFSLADMSTLVLDAHNVSGVTWIFQMSGNMSTGLGSKVILKNGASASNVYWIVGGSTSIGAGSSMEGNILSPSTIRIGASASLDGRALSESQVIFDGISLCRIPNSVVEGAFFPSYLPTSSPLILFPRASLCVISSIPSRYNQSTWSGTDASEAMMQAIAIIMGVPVSTLHCGYADQLCLLSPTRSPSVPPAKSARKVLREDSISSYSRSFSDTSYRQTMETANFFHPREPLSFSITKDIPGMYHKYDLYLPC